MAPAGTGIASPSAEADAESPLRASSALPNSLRTQYGDRTKVCASCFAASTFASVSADLVPSAASSSAPNAF